MCKCSIKYLQVGRESFFRRTKVGTRGKGFDADAGVGAVTFW